MSSAVSLTHLKILIVIVIKLKILVKSNKYLFIAVILIIFFVGNNYKIHIGKLNSKYIGVVGSFILITFKIPIFV